MQTTHETTRGTSGGAAIRCVATASTTLDGRRNRPRHGSTPRLGTTVRARGATQPPGAVGGGSFGATTAPIDRKRLSAAFG
jgi:hypothetical protein